MLFDYNHGSSYKEKNYHNKYKNIKSKRATKRPKYKYTFENPYKLPMQEYNNGHKTIKTTRATKKPTQIITFNPNLMVYPKRVNKPTNKPDELSSFQTPQFQYPKQVNEPFEIPAPLAYQKPQAAYLAFTFPSQEPKLTNNYLPIYNLPHGYFYRII